MSSEVEKAELIQSVNAFLIPSSLFLASLITSAGGFLLYNGYTLGWALIAFGLTVMAIAFTLFIRFQNKLRARGQFRRLEDSPSKGHKLPSQDSAVK